MTSHQGDKLLPITLPVSFPELEGRLVKWEAPQSNALYVGWPLGLIHKLQLVQNDGDRQVMGDRLLSSHNYGG